MKVYVKDVTVPGGSFSDLEDRVIQNAAIQNATYYKNNQAMIFDVDNKLKLTFSNNTITIASGKMIIDGCIWSNISNLVITPDRPTSGTAKGYICATVDLTGSTGSKQYTEDVLGDSLNYPVLQTEDLTQVGSDKHQVIMGTFMIDENGFITNGVDLTSDLLGGTGNIPVFKVNGNAPNANGDVDVNEVTTPFTVYRSDYTGLRDAFIGQSSSDNGVFIYNEDGTKISRWVYNYDLDKPKIILTDADISSNNNVPNIGQVKDLIGKTPITINDLTSSKTITFDEPLSFDDIESITSHYTADNSLEAGQHANPIGIYFNGVNINFTGQKTFEFGDGTRFSVVLEGSNGYLGLVGRSGTYTNIFNVKKCTATSTIVLALISQNVSSSVSVLSNSYVYDNKSVYRCSPTGGNITSITIYPTANPGVSFSDINVVINKPVGYTITNTLMADEEISINTLDQKLKKEKNNNLEEEK